MPKEPERFRPQLPDIVRMAFRARKEPEPRDELVMQLTEVVIALMEKEWRGHPVYAATPLVVLQQLVDKILDARPHVVQALREQNKRVPEGAELIELAAQRVAGNVG